MPAVVPCRVPGVNVDALWFSDSDPAMREAASRCFTCPLIEECARLGANEEHGVWGGALPTDRHRVAARRRQRELNREAIRERVRAMFAEGYSYRDIKSELGVGATFIRSVVLAA